MKAKLIGSVFMIIALATSCKKDTTSESAPLNPDTAGYVQIDRFSSAFAHLFLRNTENKFPQANEPIDFDSIPAFNTRGLGPNGEMSIYYNFDVLPVTPAQIYVLFRTGDTSSVSGQLNIVNVVPGDSGYNDFWLVNKVTVPANYVANTITSYSEIMQEKYTITATNTIVNCPVVPKGSIARKRYSTAESAALTMGWYKNKVVYYFNFSEKQLMAINGNVPIADIYVCFNINPNLANGGPSSGFKTEDSTATGQTHNVPSALPSDAMYSPLWNVIVYDNANFSMVNNLVTAQASQILVHSAAIVNCPIVWVKE